MLLSSMISLVGVAMCAFAVGATCAVDGTCGDDAAALLQVTKDNWGGKGNTCKPIQQKCSGNITGYLYNGLNGKGENKVLVVDILSDGSLGQQRSFGTGSNGGSDPTRYGPLRGDYDGQGGLQIIGDYLLVVNGGGNTVSTFLICQDGSLSLIDTVPSGGGRPVTLAFVPKSGGKKKQWKPKQQTQSKGMGTADEYWVVVGNQFANPVVLGDQLSGPLVFFPNESFHLDHLHEQPNNDLNIFLFSFDASTGKLTPERPIESFPATWGGPSTVEFNGDGTKFALSTWGIVHDFGEGKQQSKALHQRSSRLIVYDFDGKKGEFTNKRYFDSCGKSGFVGFEWHPHKDIIYLTSFNSVDERGFLVFSDSGTRVTLEQEFVADRESCWTHVHPSLKYVYSSNFQANTVTQFALGEDGKVSRVVANIARGNQNIGSDNKDFWMDSSGKNFYLQGGAESFAIAWYSISPDSGVLGLKKEVKVKELIGDEAYSSTFLGLKAYELCPSE